MVQFFEELKRRNVFRVGIAYVVTAWLVIQVIETIFPAFGFGDAASSWTGMSTDPNPSPITPARNWIGPLSPCLRSRSATSPSTSS
jgi:hypothetical protein